MDWGGMKQISLFMKSAHTRTFDLRYNRESRHLTPILLLPTKEERRLITNQPDSARFSRISKIPANQQDSPEPARFSQIGQTPSRICGLRIQQTLAHGFTSSSHLSPQLPTARDSVVSRHLSSRDSSDFLGFVGYHCVGPGPLFIDCS